MRQSACQGADLTTPQLTHTPEHPGVHGKDNFMSAYKIFLKSCLVPEENLSELYFKRKKRDVHVAVTVSEPGSGLSAVG